MTRVGATKSAATSATRLVVLPFENLGDAADAYFADGMADEVRGKWLDHHGNHRTATIAHARPCGAKRFVPAVAVEGTGAPGISDLSGRI